MAAADTFQQYLISNGDIVNPNDVILAILLAALFSFIVGKVYVKYGSALSNREKFSHNFLILATTTTLVITIVKSSLALSLGLVGALSIVRFRAAIKEPEELGFLFLVIGIGLGFGANQIWATSISISLICLLFMFRHRIGKKDEDQNLSLTITANPSSKVTLSRITTILKKYCASVHLKRFDAADNLLEASFFVTFSSFNALNNVKKELEQLSESIKLTYLDRE